MIRRTFVLLAVCFLLISTITAHADLIVPPREPHIVVSNDFYMKAWARCTYLNKHDQRYCANGEGGFVSVKEDPRSEDEIAIIKNNEECIVICTISLRDSIWGLVKDYNGWVLINELMKNEPDSSP